MARIKNILLATPPYHAGVVESAGIWPPLGLVYIAGELRRHGYTVQIYDSMSMQHTLEDVRNYLASANYDVLGVSAITASFPASVEVFRISKQVHPSALTVLGNVHGTFQYREVLSKHGDVIDIVVRGEGEVTMTQLLEAINLNRDLGEVPGIAFAEEGTIRTTPGRCFVPVLDDLVPAYDVLDWSLYKFFVMPKSRLGIVNSSRGCPHGCSFCSQQKFWQKSYRELTPQRFLEQLRELRAVHGVDVVMLSDEYPTKNRERWDEILDLLLKENMDIALLLETRVEDILRDRDILWKYRAANVLHIYVGVEATNQESLDVFKKDIKCEESQEALRLIAANGIISECSFVLGMPDETPDSIQNTLKLAKHYNPDFAHFLAITPWPYSDLFADVQDRIREWDYSKYNLVTPIVEPRRMTLEEVNMAIIECYKQFYHWKMRQFQEERDDFRRRYLLQATRVMMNNSFLSQYMKGGKMPEGISDYLRGKDAVSSPASELSAVSQRIHYTR